MTTFLHFLINLDSLQAGSHEFCMVSETRLKYESNKGNLEKFGYRKLKSGGSERRWRGKYPPWTFLKTYL